jgi:hypothetical protein
MPIDDVLCALRLAGFPYKWDEPDVKIWRSICPACRIWVNPKIKAVLPLADHSYDGWTLRLREGYGQTTISCLARCHPACVLKGFSEALETVSRGELLDALEEAARVARRALRVSEIMRAEGL